MVSLVIPACRLSSWYSLQPRSRCLTLWTLSEHWHCVESYDGRCYGVCMVYSMVNSMVHSMVYARCMYGVCTVHSMVYVCCIVLCMYGVYMVYGMVYVWYMYGVWCV